MNYCLIPNKILYDKIDQKMEKYLVKLEKMKNNTKGDRMNGGSPVIVPVIIGVIVSLFSANHDSVKYSDNPNFFKGVYSQMTSLKRGKRLYIPNDLEYNLDDDRRRIQLFELLTKKEIDGRQLQVYNSFSKPRQDQVDIQRCLYILTTAYVEHKYGKSKGNDNNIKSVIYSVFSNHMYLLALIGFFLEDNDTEEEVARLAINDVIEHAMSIESIYLGEDVICGENAYVKHIKSKKTSPMVTRSQTRKKNNELSFEEIYHPSNDDFSIENDYAGNPKLKRKDTIPMKTRSQTRKTSDHNKSSIVPAIGWKRESHMRYTGKYAKGGKKSTNRRRVSSSRKKR